MRNPIVRNSTGPGIRASLNDFDRSFDAVEEWSVERDNLFDFGSVRSSNVASC